jgi:hypothetical protein
MTRCKRVLRKGVTPVGVPFRRVAFRLSPTRGSERRNVFVPTPFRPVRTLFPSQWKTCAKGVNARAAGTAFRAKRTHTETYTSPVVNNNASICNELRARTLPRLCSVYQEITRNAVLAVQERIFSLCLAKSVKVPTVARLKL